MPVCSWDHLKNSAIISIATMLICLPLGVMAAYSASRLKFKGSNGVVLTSMITQLIPPIVLVIPLVCDHAQI